MITSVLNMFTRDVKKMVNASMRLLLYLTPILWEMSNLPKWIQKIMKCNPLYYIVEGYRSALLGNVWFFQNIKLTIYFWFIVLLLYGFGRIIFKRLKPHFADVL